MKKILNSKRIFSIISTLIALIVIIPIGAVVVSEVLIITGFKKTSVPVVGTGSMYPSLYWEISEGGPEDPQTTTLHEERTTPLMYRYFSEVKVFNKEISLKEISYGDMVAFRNVHTAEILEAEGKNPTSGFIKRVIGTPGDKIVIRDGFVFKNGEILEEPYIYKPRSTYGGSSITDCQEVIVPTGKVLVMGDNRKISTDSRHDLGLIEEKDVNYILPYEEQGIYKELWRDTSKDEDLREQPTLDKQRFVTLLNEVRVKSSSDNLTLKPTLSSSARLRADVILRTNDFSTEATRSGYTAVQAMSEAGYSNIVTGEFISQGYYTADELINNLTYFTETKSQITDPKYDDIGIAIVNGSVNSCPTQVIVGHLGGYIPPDYNQETIDSWKSLREDLDRVIPSWEKARDYEGLDQGKIEELLSLLYKRRALAQEIYNAMINNEWLTEDQQRRIEEDSSVAKRANEIIDSINP